GDEKNCSKGRNNKAHLGDFAFVQRSYPSAVPQVGPSINFRIGIEYLAPPSRKRNADAVVAIDLWSEIHHHQTPVPGRAPFAQPHKNAPIRVMHDKPFESRRVAVELVQCRERTIEAVQVADQPLNASMLGPLQKVPVEGMVVAPFILLCKLVAHEKQFLPGMPEHETEIGAQIGEALPLTSRHPSEERLFAVHHLV